MINCEQQPNSCLVSILGEVDNRLIFFLEVQSAADFIPYTTDDVWLVTHLRTITKAAEPRQSYAMLYKCIRGNLYRAST